MNRIAPIETKPPLSRFSCIKRPFAFDKLPCSICIAPCAPPYMGRLFIKTVPSLGGGDFSFISSVIITPSRFQKRTSLNQSYGTDAHTKQETPNGAKGQVEWTHSRTSFLQRDSLYSKVSFLAPSKYQTVQRRRVGCICWQSLPEHSGADRRSIN